VLLVALIVGFVLTRGGGGKNESGACLTELAGHLPQGRSPIISGTDVGQARSAGYDDGGSLEDLGTSQRETGALPDQLTAQVRARRLISSEDFTAQTGVKPENIHCSLSEGSLGVLSGSFNVAEVRGSALGAKDLVVASQDVLAVGPTSGGKLSDLLKTQSKGSVAANDDVAAVISSLRDQDAYSIVVQRAEKQGPVRAAGIGVTGKPDALKAVLAWRFAKGKAEAGRREVVERANDALEGSASISSTDLKVNGDLVTSVIDVRKAPDLSGLISSGGPPLIRAAS